MPETDKSFTADEARAIGQELGIDWATSPFDVEQLRIGMKVELEHGLHDPRTDVSNDDPHVTAKIALAHLNEFPDYYTRLEQLEEEAKRDWAKFPRSWRLASAVRCLASSREDATVTGEG